MFRTGEQGRQSALQPPHPATELAGPRRPVYLGPSLERDK